jgi:hypothetical protein
VTTEPSVDQECAIEIDREHLAPVGKGHLGKFLLREDAGAIDHDIDMTEFAVDRFGHGGDRWLRRHVAIDGKRLATGGLHQLHGVLAVGDIGHRDMHAVLGQPFRESLPDAVGATGDDGDFVLVTLGHSISPA